MPTLPAPTVLAVVATSDQIADQRDHFRSRFHGRGYVQSHSRPVHQQRRYARSAPSNALGRQPPGQTPNTSSLCEVPSSPFAYRALLGVQRECFSHFSRFQKRHLLEHPDLGLVLQPVPYDPRHHHEGNGLSAQEVCVRAVGLLVGYGHGTKRRDGGQIPAGGRIGIHLMFTRSVAPASLAEFRTQIFRICSAISRCIVESAGVKK